MKVVTFDRAHAIMEFDSHGATIAGVARSRGEARVSLLKLGAGGRVGEHPTASPQLFLVVGGSGWVQGADKNRRPIADGQGALWAAAEAHESGSDNGLTAIVVEAESLELL